MSASKYMLAQIAKKTKSCQHGVHFHLGGFLPQHAQIATLSLSPKVQVDFHAKAPIFFLLCTHIHQQTKISNIL